MLKYFESGKTDYTVLGLMSGSSLDGLDLALVNFNITPRLKINSWELIYSETQPYKDDIQEQLLTARNLSGKNLSILNVALGKYYGHVVNEFINRYKIDIDLIASHGHTIFHEPQNLLTLQIGEGSAIAESTGITTICDFRKTDIYAGGIGTPLAPLADRLLFSGHNAYLNLGGIANMFIEDVEKPVSFDICPCNQLLNHLSKMENVEFDKGGHLASSGEIIRDMLTIMNDWEFYEYCVPRSLDNSQLMNYFLALFDRFNRPTCDLLRTTVEHISQQIANTLNKYSAKKGSVLITGGGAFNSFLISEIQSKLSNTLKLVVPDEKIVNFKEAILIALAGLRGLHGEAIFFGELTGANKNCSGGALYWP